MLSEDLMNRCSAPSAGKAASAVVLKGIDSDLNNLLLHVRQRWRVGHRDKLVVNGGRPHESCFDSRIEVVAKPPAGIRIWVHPAKEGIVDGVVFGLKSTH